MPPRNPRPYRTTSSVASEFSVNSAGADFCTRIPKAELHVHIEGSLEPEMMFALAKRNRVALPYDTVEEVREAYSFQDLQEFLDLYFQGAAVMVHVADFEDVLYAYLCRAHADGVCRAELFFDPQTHTRRGVTFSTFMEGFRKAMQRARHEFGISTALIMCFLRHLSSEDALQTWQEASPYVQDGTIIGVGLDSTELGIPPEKFKQVFALAKQTGLRAVAHAGEEGPPEYVVKALDELGVERVDHGVRAEEDEKLVERLVESQIALTVCPFSNVALKVFDRLEDHNVKRLLDRGVAVTINSDDPAYFGGYIAENYRATAEALELTQDEVVKLARMSLESSFATKEEKAGWLSKLDQYVREANKKIAGMVEVDETALLTMSA